MIDKGIALVITILVLKRLPEKLKKMNVPKAK